MLYRSGYNETGVISVEPPGNYNLHQNYARLAENCGTNLELFINTFFVHSGSPIYFFFNLRFDPFNTNLAQLGIR